MNYVYDNYLLRNHKPQWYSEMDGNITTKFEDSNTICSPPGCQLCRQVAAKIAPFQVGFCKHSG